MMSDDFLLYCKNKRVKLTKIQEDAAMALLGNQGGQILFSGKIGTGKTFFCKLLEGYAHSLEKRNG
jgi:tRNA A37 threonylcarbamoyladenosine biosynthesis protein TsaE